MGIFKKVAFTILAFIAGYAAMVIGLYISQDAFFGGIVIGETKLWQLAIAGIGALGSAFIGGLVAARLAPIKNMTAPIILALETVVESIYLYLGGAFPNPLWFDIMSELTLLIGILAGGYYYLSRYRNINYPAQL